MNRRHGEPDIIQNMAPIRSTTRRSLLQLGLAMIAAMLVLGAAPAYDHSLSSEAVREAYFLGRRGDVKTSEFFEKYSKRLPEPNKGPYISDISLLTPYAQVVFRSWHNPVGYSAQQAEEDYRRAGDSIRIKVRIEFTATYSAVQNVKSDKSRSGGDAFTLRPEDFWHDFKFELFQDERLIAPRSLHGTPVYDKGGFRGAEVWLEYDPDQLASETTSVEVVTPDDDHVSAKFDLSDLR